MRSELLFNDGWRFAPQQVQPDAPDDGFEPVTLPHTNKILPYHNFDNREYQFTSTYRKRFTLPEARNGRRIHIEFEGAMLISTVYLNGVKLGTHAGGYTPFSFDITDYVRETGENTLTVHLDASEDPDVPPFGYVVDYLTFGGIYREVRLRMVEPIHIQDVFVRTPEALTENRRAEVDVMIRNASMQPQRITVSAALEDTRDETGIDMPADSSQTVTLSLPAVTCSLWSLEDPQQYTLQVRVSAQELLDEQHIVFGFRDIEFRDSGGFYLNGEHIKLFGLNRHQTYPYIGAAAPARLQQQDADIVKFDLGCNIVRTSHYPQSRHFLDRCDEIGLLVVEEIPGWQHIGDEDWQALSLRDVEAMIRRDRNRPSIILWGVRVNESLDNDALYRKTNALAHQMDPTRPTTGIRYFQDSSFLEDVFGFNDFSNGVEEPQNVPHLITEFNGHMFPTKTFDNEERRIEHARRHAFIQNKQMGMDNVLGAIGWCAFDYNTHKEFGSGDRICYHGVMDIFRMPKWAAAFYKSQQNPSQNIVLEAATLWTMGDRSAGGNEPITVYSNCDEIDVYFGEQHLGRFQPDRDTYPHLPHPPFQVTGLGMMMMWGQAFGTLKITGYLNGEQVTAQHISSDGVPESLMAWADFPQLRADGGDMTPVKFKITDEFGNVLPYTNQVVSIEVEGPGELIGENPFALAGGQGAVYLKATHEPGKVTLRLSTPRLEPVTISVEIQH